MMTTTKPLNTKKVYRVVFEQLQTNKIFIVFVEADRGDLAAQSVLDNLGQGYDLVQVRTALKGDLN